MKEGFGFDVELVFFGCDPLCCACFVGQIMFWWWQRWSPPCRPSFPPWQPFLWWRILWNSYCEKKDKYSGAIKTIVMVKIPELVDGERQHLKALFWPPVSYFLTRSLRPSASCILRSPSPAVSWCRAASGTLGSGAPCRNAAASAVLLCSSPASGGLGAAWSNDTLTPPRCLPVPISAGEKRGEEWKKGKKCINWKNVGSGTRRESLDKASVQICSLFIYHAHLWLQLDFQALQCATEVSDFCLGR